MDKSFFGFGSAVLVIGIFFFLNLGPLHLIAKDIMTPVLKIFFGFIFSVLGVVLIVSARCLHKIDTP